MAGRIRSIKPEILEDEEASRLSSDAWRLWVSMWTLADDHGNLHAAPSKLHGQVFWARPPHDPVPVLLQELVDARRIKVYRVNGSQFVHINNWEKHQRIDNAGKKRAPKPEEADVETAPAETRGDSPRNSANRGDSPLDLRPPTKTSDQDHRPADSGESAKVGKQESLVLVPTEPVKPRFDFEGVYRQHYPRKEGKQRGMELCEEQVTTPAKFEAWTRAVKNYAAIVASENRDPDKIKFFSSFMACWTEYVDAAPARASPKRYSNFAEPMQHAAETHDEEL